MSIWPFKKRDIIDLGHAAKAKEKAEEELERAKEQYQIALCQRDKLDKIKQKNHISESLTRAFGWRSTE